MADTLRVDVRKGAEELVDIELDFEDGHDRLHFVEISRGAVHGLRNELEYQIQVNFIFLG